MSTQFQFNITACSQNCLFYPTNAYIKINLSTFAGKDLRLIRFHADALTAEGSAKEKYYYH